MKDKKFDLDFKLTIKQNVYLIKMVVIEPYKTLDPIETQLSTPDKTS